MCRQEGQLIAWRGAVLALVQARFPKLFRLTKHLIGAVDQTNMLQILILKISTPSSLGEARQYLLEIIEEEEDSQD